MRLSALRATQRIAVLLSIQMSHDNANTMAAADARHGSGPRAQDSARPAAQDETAAWYVAALQPRMRCTNPTCKAIITFPALRHLPQRCPVCHCTPFVAPGSFYSGLARLVPGPDEHSTYFVEPEPVLPQHRANDESGCRFIVASIIEA